MKEKSKESFVLHDIRREAEILAAILNKSSLTGQELSKVKNGVNLIKYLSEKVYIYDSIQKDSIEILSLEFDFQNFINDIFQELGLIFDDFKERVKSTISSFSVRSDPALLRLIFINMLENSYLHGFGDINLNLDGTKETIICSNYFNSTDKKSEGLGLIIIKNLAERLGIEYQVLVKENLWSVSIDFQVHPRA